MAVVSPHVSIIALKVNGLNSPIKGGVVGCIKKQDQTTCSLPETHLSYKGKNKVKGWEMISNQMSIKRKADVALLVSTKYRFQDKKGSKRQRRRFYHRKGDDSSKRRNVIKVCAPNLGAPKYTLIQKSKGESDKNSIIIEDLNTPLTAIIQTESH